MTNGRTLYGGFIAFLLGLIVYTSLPLMPFLAEEYKWQVTRGDEVIVDKVVSTSPDWRVVDGRVNLRENPNCSDDPDYSTDWVIVDWPDELSPPVFLATLYPLLWSTPHADRILLRGELVGCRNWNPYGEDRLILPVFRVDTWVTPDKKIYAYTEAGETPACLFVMLIFILFLTMVWKVVGARRVV